MKFNIIFDKGNKYKYKIMVSSKKDCKEEILKFYAYNKFNDYDLNFKVYNKDGLEITETDFIKKIVEDILKNE